MEKLDKVCLLTFVVDVFSGFILHLPVFIKHSRSALRPSFAVNGNLKARHDVSR